MDAVETIHWRLARNRFTVLLALTDGANASNEMRVINLFTVPLAASFMLSATARAADTTGLPWNVQNAQRGSPVAPGHNPAPDWTAAIGTGRAAVGESRLESRVESSHPLSRASSQRYPQADWTSVIGSGVAAKR
jgi:hypothetical protein